MILHPSITSDQDHTYLNYYEILYTVPTNGEDIWTLKVRGGGML